MIPIPPGEKVIENKQCQLSGKEFFVTDKDLEFYDKVSPVLAGKRYPIPSPTLCPDERQRRRLSWRNERILYKRKCDKTERDILSLFSSEKTYPVYDQKVWWSDEWSPADFGRDFDFSQTAFSQMSELDKKVPKLARSMLFEENCDYVNQAGNVRDCFWVFEAESSEKCYFGEDTLNTQRCIDFLGVNQCQFCYEVVDCIRCNNLFYSQNCNDCRDSCFLSSCYDCTHCFGCINLSKREYCFFNEQLSQEEYEKRLHAFSLGEHLALVQKKVQSFFQTQVFREHQNKKSENVLGDKIFESQNVFHSFDVIGGKDIHYCEIIKGPIHDCYDVSTFGVNSSYCFESVTVGHSANNVGFCSECWENVTNLWYCLYCNKGVKDCFLSTGLKQKAEHCILNKPYSVEEYETLCGRIIDHMVSTGEWGEFFPHELSPFGYNETLAQEYFPMTEKEVREKGWRWYSEPNKGFEGAKIAPLPIVQYDEKKVGFETAQSNINTLLGGTIQCSVTGKPFRIIKQELAFYIEHGLPIPTKHPDQRHRERMTQRNPRELHERYCAECHGIIQTTYAPDRPERVICEECYRKTVY